MGEQGHEDARDGDAGRWRAMGWDTDWEPPPAGDEYDEAMAADEPASATWIASLPPDIREY